MNMTRGVAPILISAIALGLAGCNHLPKFASLMKARAVPADLGPIGPNSAEDRLYADSVKAIDKRNYGEAIGLLQVAREARPGDPRVLTAMGVVYDKLGRFDLSDRYYDQAEKIDPNSRIVAIDRRYSMFLRNAGKFGDRSGVALAQAQSPTTVTAANAPKLATGADLYAQSVGAIQKHEYGVALGLLRQARDAKPGDVRILTALGVTYDHLGRFDLSTRYYAEAQKIDPASAVLAQDRHTSAILQQHGGFSGPDDIVVLAKTGPAGQPAILRVAKAAPRRGGRG
ncbi:MAG TPA: tetratricopeptide repeat protein [Caulobacteraceae bacterium]